MEKINSKASIEMLLKIVIAYNKTGNELNEPCDIANELGIILGEQCTDKENLIREFVMGFEHGVELSEHTTADERVFNLRR